MSVKWRKKRRKISFLGTYRLYIDLCNEGIHLFVCAVKCTRLEARVNRIINRYMLFININTRVPNIHWRTRCRSIISRRLHTFISIKVKSLLRQKRRCLNMPVGRRNQVAKLNWLNQMFENNYKPTNGMF